MTNTAKHESTPSKRRTADPPESQSGGNVQVTINGVLDALQPTVANTDQVIVYGSKANDKITVDPGLTIPVTLNGGTGGTNVLKAGGGPTTELGWYGQNRLVQGSSQNFQFGQNGHVTFVGPRVRGQELVQAGGQPGQRGQRRADDRDRRQRLSPARHLRDRRRHRPRRPRRRRRCSCP